MPPPELIATPSHYRFSPLRPALSPEMPLPFMPMLALLTTLLPLTLPPPVLHLLKLFQLNVKITLLLSLYY